MAVGKAIDWSDIANGAVKAHLVVMVDKGFGNALGIIKSQRCFRSDGLLLQRAVEAFDLAIALRIEWACADVRHPRDLHEVLEVIRDELRTVVADNPRFLAVKPLQAALHDRFDLPLLHRFAQFPMDDVATEAIKQRTQKEKGSTKMVKLFSW